MRRLVAIACGLGLLVLSAFSATSLLHAAARTGTPEPAAETLTFDIAFRDTLVADDLSSPGLGDRFILNDLILEDGETVGHNGGVCTIIDEAHETMCTVIFSLPEGTIVAAYLNTPSPEETFAIVGGTGKYEGARGQGELIEAPDLMGWLTFEITS